MPALLRYASAPLSSAEKLRVLQALQQSQPQKLERFVALNGPKLLEQWISLELADLADQIPSVDIQKEVENPSFVDDFWRKAMSFQHLMLVYIRGMIKLEDLSST